jgi:Holliday junction resolvase RusA-like endonuclease
MAKARPNFDSRTKRAYMPKEYMEWKESVADFIKLQRVPSLSGAVGMDISFRKSGFVVVASETQLKRYGRSDIDNLMGGVMDAVQDGGGYKNDSQVAGIRAQFYQEE